MTDCLNSSQNVSDSDSKQYDTAKRGTITGTITGPKTITEYIETAYNDDSQESSNDKQFFSDENK